MILKHPASAAKFDPGKMAKSTLVRGDHLFAGLNCFEPGQEHSPHVHADQDKLYVILEGSATVQVADETSSLNPGDAAFAPAGIEHSIRNLGPARLVVMVILTPPPA
jgi:quercetin dioxygenase-like cupin family protein